MCVHARLGGSFVCLSTATATKTNMLKLVAAGGGLSHVAWRLCCLPQLPLRPPASPLPLRLKPAQSRTRRKIHSASLSGVCGAGAGRAVGACGVIAVHHLQQHLSANLFALVSIGAPAAAAAALFAFHSASVWTVCNRFPLVLLSMCATRGGASACDILYAIHIPPPLTHECRLRRRCCLRLQLGNASTLTSAGHMHIRHSEAEAGGVRCPPTNTNTTSPGRVSRGRALRFAQW